MSEIKEVEMQQELKQEKEYVYNKNNKAKIVKRKYTVTSENARNPDIRNRIIEVMNKNKEELLKVDERKVIKSIQELLKKENLPGSYNFIKKHWLILKESKSNE